LANKIAQASSGVDGSLAKKRYGFNTQIPLLLNAGSLRKPKGHLILLETAAILKEKGISFLLAIG
jgi:hypothetical protein